MTVGHNAVIHGSKVHDYMIVGMNSTLLEGPEAGPNSMIAARSAVLEKEKTPPRVLLADVPAKIVGKLDDSDLAVIKCAAEAYVELVKACKEKS